MTWRKSSFTESANCVEVRGDLAAIRDSKQPEVVMPISRVAVAGLTRFAKRPV
ncbi:DUF397 domain-containing protein [Actinophytocola xanthii]|uniref:DUF397 domain-containing protein n=1 Tax=Actinophytocola xanthii TaxID=1912961 RepID=UPI0009FB69D9|nr:DUF397 domain-containing protein [Actinophytocola xanthii]